MAAQGSVEPVTTGTCLLHIGPYKSGSTAIQRAAAGRRAELAAHDVAYPGSGINHRWGFSALSGFTWGWSGADARRAPDDLGTDLLAEVARARTTARVWLSYERLCVLEEAAARELCDRIGAPVHVVIGLRPLRSLLPSEWQQLVKNGRRTGALDHWAHRKLRAVTTGGPKAGHLDHARLVERWAGVLGVDAVSCIALDSRRHDVLTDAFEALLGLPGGLLAPAAENRHHLNRSLTASEAAVVAAVAERLRGSGIGHSDYQRIVSQGVIRSLRSREPATGEPRLRLSPVTWARAATVDREAAARIADLGVRVFGDLGVYSGERDVPPGAAAPVEVVEDPVPLAVAVAAALGAAEPSLRPPDLAAVPARRLAGALLRRARQHVRQGFGG
ncbi:MAG: hypothetical protein KDB60_05510 [Propionibacteriaceae bacterium]|nr:hypothetical protein [Propionibacteriaceae bacterium]